MYAKEVYNRSKFVFKQFCWGCQSVSLSQIACMLSIAEHLKRYFKQIIPILDEKVQVGNDQEKVQSEKESHSNNRGGKKTN